MKIQKISIKGFGALKDKEITLSDGLNIFYGENESGKSTIAEFIKAVLYGIDSGVRDVRENERLRYMPLDGGVMGGSLEVTHGGKSFLITRIFGKTKSGDKLLVIDSVTGAELNLSPEELIGLNKDSFAKTLYIKQLSVKIEGTKNDEILKKLINLSQTGEEEASYQNAKVLLQDALKELTSKTKGIIPKLHESISMLQAERAEAMRAGERAADTERKMQAYQNEQADLQQELSEQSEEAVLKEQYAKWSNVIKEAELQNQLKKEQEQNRRLQFETLLTREKSKQANKLYVFFISIFLSLFSFFIRPFLLILIPAFLFLILYWKDKQRISSMEAEYKDFGKDACNNPADDVQYKQWFSAKLGSNHFPEVQKLIEAYCKDFQIRQQEMNSRNLWLAEKIRDLQNEKNQIKNRAVVAIDQDITMKTNQLRGYEAKENAIRAAMEALDKAFSELEQNFAPMLNRHTAAVLSGITNGKYQQVRADNIYQLTLTDQQGNLIKSDYLSSGCYDQIYFSLRMGMIEMLDIDAPIILDDAFAYYDDNRLNKAMEYLRSLKRQIILFTCQKRENGEKIFSEKGLILNEA